MLILMSDDHELEREACAETLLGRKGSLATSGTVLIDILNGHNIVQTTFTSLNMFSP